MKRILKSEKAHNRVVEAIILIAVTVAVSIAVAAFMGALTITFSTGIEINPQIYSVDYNFGVLNENAVFDISIENSLNESRKFNIVVSAEENEVYSEPIEIIGLEKRNIIINQKLLFSGLWTIKIFEENKIIDSYSFVTLINKAEADLKITQMDNINFNNNLSSISLIVSVSTLILGILSFWYLKVRVKKVEKSKIEKETKKQREPDSK